MEIKYGIAACTNAQEEEMMFMQYGKYLLVGFADLNSKYRMPVWRKI
jgi:hypothetical protein